jgi:hypothetical protein
VGLDRNPPEAVVGNPDTLSPTIGRDVTRRLVVSAVPGTGWVVSSAIALMRHRPDERPVDRRGVLSLNTRF